MVTADGTRTFVDCPALDEIAAEERGLQRLFWRLRTGAVGSAEARGSAGIGLGKRAARAR